MSSRGYHKLNMLQTTESIYSWGGTDYTAMVLDDGETIPSGVGTSNYTTGGRVDLPSITDTTQDFVYIFPSVIDAVSIIDGIISGTFKLGVEVTDAGAATITATKAEVTLKAIDTSGTSRDMSDKKQIWSGSISQSSLGGITTVHVMYWVGAEDAIIESNERLAVTLTVTFSTVDGSSNSHCLLYIYCTPNVDDTTITLPFVM